MITRMEILYRSKNPCDKKPSLFTTGSYTVKVAEHEFLFDFQEMTACSEIKDGYLYIDVFQKNLDESLYDEIAPAKADILLRQAKKEDFLEIFYECFADNDETIHVPLEPLKITFYDYSVTGDGAPIAVGGERFCNLVE